MLPVEFDANQAQKCNSPRADATPHNLTPGTRCAYVNDAARYIGPRPWCADCLNLMHAEGATVLTREGTPMPVPQPTGVQLCQRTGACSKRTGWTNAAGRGEPPRYVCASCGLPGAAPITLGQTRETVGDRVHNVSVSAPGVTPAGPSESQPPPEQPSPPRRRGRPAKPLEVARVAAGRWCIRFRADPEAILLDLIKTKGEATDVVGQLEGWPVDWSEPRREGRTGDKPLWAALANEQNRVAGLAHLYREEITTDALSQLAGAAPDPSGDGAIRDPADGPGTDHAGHLAPDDPTALIPITGTNYAVAHPGQWIGPAGSGGQPGAGLPAGPAPGPAGTNGDQRGALGETYGGDQGRDQNGIAAATPGPGLGDPHVPAPHSLPGAQEAGQQQDQHGQAPQGAPGHLGGLPGPAVGAVETQPAVVPGPRMFGQPLVIPVPQPVVQQSGPAGPSITPGPGVQVLSNCPNDPIGHNFKPSGPPHGRGQMEQCQYCGHEQWNEFPKPTAPVPEVVIGQPPASPEIPHTITSNTPAGLAYGRTVVSKLEEFAAQVRSVSLSSNTSWGQRYAAELRELVLWHANHAPRNLQKHLGPSEIGHQCDRQVIGKLVGFPKTNNVVDAWASLMGTAGHAWMEKAFTAENQRLGWQRWTTENRVTPHPNHPGTADLYDAQSRAVVDHKFLGETSMAKVRSAAGPPLHYQIQLKLYALGYRNMGWPVERVVLLAWPRTSSTSDGVYVWDHVLTDEDDHQLAEVFDRMEWREQWAEAIRAGHADLMQAPASPDADECYFCPFYRPQAVDGGPGCPGHAGLA